MPRTRTLRDEPPPGPVELVFRGILGDTGLDPADLRQAAVLNHELYGFYGVSVWVADLAFSRELLESTKLVKFERYAEFTVAGLTGCGASAVGHRTAPALRWGVRRQRPGEPGRAAGCRAPPDRGQPQRRPGGALR